MLAAYHWTALATLAAVLVYMVSVINVAMARRCSGVQAPAITGEPRFERAFRAQQNILEWMPIFLPALWLFALTQSDIWGAALGALWCLARLGYIFAYTSAANRRGPFFGLQFLASLALWVGALVGTLQLAG